jgi:hypothetical protein
VTRADSLRRAEWVIAVALSAAILFFMAVRFAHAGALWRDECAVVNLARMPSVADVVRNFQHEAFPVPFPLLVRAYTNAFGSTDFALRLFGILTGIALLCAIWFTGKLIAKGPPLIALGLLGLNATFLFWGTTIRGYGLGATLIVLTFALFAALLREPSTPRIIFAAFASLAAVQCLVHNLALIGAFTVAAGVVSLLKHDAKRLIIFLGLLALCLISFLPYLDAYSSSWSQVVQFPVTPRLLWNQFNFALGNPNPAMAWFWRIAFVALLIVAIRQLWTTRHNKSAPEWDLVLFASISAIVAPIFYYKFLQTLSYLTRSWYFIALIAAVAIALDSLAAVLSGATWIRIGRILFAAIVLIVLPINAWPIITQRQTNIDIVAKKVSDEAKASDLVVIAPWQYAISFSRYYHGTTPSLTLPIISDLRVHRYDLFRDKMIAEHPIDDVLEKIRETLVAGNRVWIVGEIKLPPEGRPPRQLPPAQSNNGAWDNVAYSDAWQEQLSAFVRQHTEKGQSVSLPSRGAINPFEDVPLTVVEGWQ